MGQHPPLRKAERGRLGTLLVPSLLILALLSGACLSDQGDTADPAALVSAGEALFVAEGCIRCHGEQGQGVIGPRLNQGAVLETFPSCDDQVQWISLGSAGWIRGIGPTYGSTAKPVRGGMPGFGRRLDTDQIAQVAAFTRVVFGGEDPAEAASDCMD